jgi:DNA-binding MurR/RpiR family transcriptional regulator
MSGRPSAATELAIKYHRQLKKSVYEAAALAGVSPSTLYRALKRKGKK